MNFKKIFITGGAGYAGSCLVPELLKKGYEVTVYDIMYYTDKYLPKNNPKLKIIKGDIRDNNKIYETSKNHDVFVHLACISNDNSFALDEKLSTSINLDAFEPMVKSAKKAGIKRFIYASSSSVYGISDKKNVTEDHPLVPLTLYNKYKGLGGDQLRPNLHVMDYSDAVEVLINSESKKIQNQIFNIGYQNLSILDIANLVKKVVEKKFPTKKDIKIIREKSDDNRSYHINSDKIKKVLDYSPKRSIENAVEDLCNAFEKNLLLNSFTEDIYFNINRMKNIKAK